jgi:hypothetical protein
MKFVDVILCIILEEKLNFSKEDSDVKDDVHVPTLTS